MMKTMRHLTVLYCSMILLLVAGCAVKNKKYIQSCRVLIPVWVFALTAFLATFALMETANAEDVSEIPAIEIAQLPFEALRQRFDLDGNGILDGRDAVVLLKNTDALTGRTELDLNGDGLVSLADGMILATFLGVPQQSVTGLLDVNDDGRVDLEDYRVQVPYMGSVPNMINAAPMARLRKAGWQGSVRWIPERNFIFGPPSPDKTALEVRTPGLVIIPINLMTDLSQDGRQRLREALGIEQGKPLPLLWLPAIETSSTMPTGGVNVKTVTVLPSGDFRLNKEALQALGGQNQIILGAEFALRLPQGKKLPLRAADFLKHTEQTRVAGGFKYWRVMLSNWMIPGAQAAVYTPELAPVAKIRRKRANKRAIEPTNRARHTWNTQSKAIKKQIARLQKEKQQALSEIKADPNCRALRCEGAQAAKQAIADADGAIRALVAIMMHNSDAALLQRSAAQESKDLSKNTIAQQKVALAYLKIGVLAMDAISIDLTGALQHSGILGKGLGTTLAGKTLQGGIKGAGKALNVITPKAYKVKIKNTGKGGAKDIKKGAGVAAAKVFAGEIGKSIGRHLGGETGGVVGGATGKLSVGIGTATNDYLKLAEEKRNPEEFKAKIGLMVVTAVAKAYLTSLKGDLNKEMRQYVGWLVEDNLKIQIYRGTETSINNALGAAQNILGGIQDISGNIGNALDVCNVLAHVNDCASRFARTTDQARKKLKNAQQRMHNTMEKARKPLQKLDREISKINKELSKNLKKQMKNHLLHRLAILQGERRGVENSIDSVKNYSSAKAKAYMGELTTRKKKTEKEISALKNKLGGIANAGGVSHANTASAILEGKRYRLQANIRKLIGKRKKMILHLKKVKDRADKVLQRTEREVGGDISNAEKALEACLAKAQAKGRAHTVQRAKPVVANTPKTVTRAMIFVSGAASANSFKLAMDNAVNALGKVKIYTVKLQNDQCKVAGESYVDQPDGSGSGNKPSDIISGGKCIAGAADLTNPIIRDMPASESAANKAKSAIGGFAKGALGGLLGGGGGMFGGGNPFGGGGNKGASMVRKPKGPWDKVESGKTGLKLGGWMYKPRSKKKKPEIRIAQRITDSVNNGAPDSMWLQDANGNILQPVGYMIFELWRHWKLTITITRESYVNGELVSRSVTRESTQWKELADRYAVLMEAPSIWERLGGKAFDKLKGVIVEFPLPDNFDPSQWSLITHVTSKVKVNGKEVIKTVPFVMNITQGKKKRLRFSPAADGKTKYQLAHPDCP